LVDDFKLIDSFDFTYTMPSGNTRDYIYTLSERLKFLALSLAGISMKK